MSGHQTMPCRLQNCFEVVPKRVQRRDSPDTRWQRVPATHAAAIRILERLGHRSWTGGLTAQKVSTCWPIEDGDEHQLQWSGEVSRRGEAAPCYGGSDGPEHTTGI